MKKAEIKQVLKECKAIFLMKEGSDRRIIKDLAEDAASNSDLWITMDMDEFMDSDSPTQLEEINDNIDEYFEDAWENIEEALGNTTDCEKWLKKHRKNIIKAIHHEMMK